jgi:hypothetical protein
VIIGSLTATGVATGGLGALAAGVAQLKDAFGGGEPAPTSEQTTPQQAQPTSADDD